MIAPTRMRRLVVTGLLPLLVPLWVAACSRSTLAVAGPCPCLAGWICCSDTDSICVREAGDCPERREDTSAVPDANLRDASIDSAGNQDSATVETQPPEALPAPAGCVTGRWCWSTPEPTGDDYVALWGQNVRDLWLVTASGTVVHHDGTRFETRYQATSETVHATLWGRADDDVWFALDGAQHATLVHWNGSQFQSPPKSVSSLPRIYGMRSSAESYWMVGESGAVIRMRAGSVYPSQQETGIPMTANLLDVSPLTDEDVWVLASDGTVYHGGKGLSVWTNEGKWPGTVAVWARATDDVWLATEEYDSGWRMVFRHFDGKVWTELSSSGCGSYRSSSSVAFSSRPRHFWATDANDAWLTSETMGCTWHWNGTSWSGRAGGLNFDIYDNGDDAFASVWSDGVETLAAGRFGRISRWTSAGTWEPLVAPVVNGTFARIAARAEDDVYALSQADIVHRDVVHFDGQSWKTLPRIPTAAINYPPYYVPVDVGIVGRADLWFAGVIWHFEGPPSGYLAHWDGTSWGPALTLDTTPVGMFVRSPKEVWAAGHSWVRRWDGEGWSAIPSDLCITALLHVASDTWIRGTEGFDPYGACRTQSGAPPLLRRWNGSEFVAVAPASQPEAGFKDWVFGFGRDDLWSGGETLSHWDGRSWTNIALPENVSLSDVWGPAPDDLWFVGVHRTPDPFRTQWPRRRTVAYHWDGVRLVADLAAPIGQGAAGITGTGNTMFISGQGILRGGR